MDIETIETTAAPIPKPWNYLQMGVALIVGLLLQSLVLPCACSRGSAKMAVAFAFDALIVVRMWMAYRRRETGRGWIFYAVLTYTSAGWIEAIAYHKH